MFISRDTKRKDEFTFKAPQIRICRGDRMKKREVIIGKAIAVVILIATIIIHKFVFELPYVLALSLVIFSALLYTLCTIGGKRRKKQDESQKLIGK
jgi:hypothetical protein